MNSRPRFPTPAGSRLAIAELQSRPPLIGTAVVAAFALGIMLATLWWVAILWNFS